MKQKKKATTTRMFCCACSKSHPASKMTTIARKHQQHIERLLLFYSPLVFQRLKVAEEYLTTFLVNFKDIYGNEH